MPKKSTAHPSALWLKILAPDGNGDIALTPLNPDDSVKHPIFLAKHKKFAPKTDDHVLARLELHQIANDENEKNGDAYYHAHILHLIPPQTEAATIGMITQNQQEWWFYSAMSRTSKNRIDLQLDKKWVQKQGLKHGDLISAILKQEKMKPSIKSCKLLCRQDEPHALSYITLAQFNIPLNFPDDVLQQAKQLPPFEPSTSKKNKRVDLTDLPFVTIDGADAKDFDDAVYATHHSDTDTLILYVAIADVSHYVTPHSPLDKEAMKRGNSVYLPDMAVPMLPERLSNDLCSLVPNQIRPVLVAKMHILKNGMIADSDFFRGFIHSAARLTYEQAEKIVHSHKPKRTEKLKLDSLKPHKLKPQLDCLYQAYQQLQTQRKKRGAIDLERTEYRINFDKDFLPVDITPTPRLDSHQMIEEAMIAANVAVAQFLTEKMVSCVYRIHDMPSKEKAEELRLTAINLGLEMPKRMGNYSKDYQQLLQRAKGRDFYALITDATLRAQAQAVYARENIGHFGLALHHYCHFTSPIRRYADLLVHRALVFLIDADNLDNSKPTISDEICTHISVTERNAQKCEYACFDRYSALLAENYIDKKMSGTITHIGEAGLFIRLDETRVEGFLPARLLFARKGRGDYQRGRYQQRESLSDYFTTQQSIDVIVMESDPLTANVTFAPADKMNLTKDKGNGKGKSNHSQTDRYSDKKKNPDKKSYGKKPYAKKPYAGRSDDRKTSPDNKNHDKKKHDNKPHDKRDERKDNFGKKSYGKTSETKSGYGKSNYGRTSKNPINKR